MKANKRLYEVKVYSLKYVVATYYFYTMKEAKRCISAQMKEDREQNMWDYTKYTIRRKR